MPKHQTILPRRSSLISHFLCLVAVDRRLVASFKPFHGRAMEKFRSADFERQPLNERAIVMASERGANIDKNRDDYKPMPQTWWTGREGRFQPSSWPQRDGPSMPSTGRGQTAIPVFGYGPWRSPPGRKVPVAMPNDRAITHRSSVFPFRFPL